MDVKHSNTILLLTFLIIHCLLPTSLAAQLNITTDRAALLAFKTRIASDPNGILESSWRIQSSVCNWTGVTCDDRHKRVTKLNISHMDLTGTIPPEFGNLSFLISLDVGNNNLGKTLPEDLSRLGRLTFVRVDYNRFTGEVPSWFSDFPQLQYLSLKNNSFTSLDSFLVSSVNGSKLATLDVTFNLLQEIPKSIGNLHNLKVLRMQGNRLSGPIPPSMVNMSNLETLILAQNSIEGEILEGIGKLLNLKLLNMEHNHLIGSIPLSIFNITTLEHIAFSYNGLSGTIPNDICLGASARKGLYLSANWIRGWIPSNFSSCPQLQILSLSYNSFTGTIPPEVGSLEMLETLDLGGKKLSGQIPPEIGKLQNLQDMGFERNKLTGSIPPTIFNITNLQYLVLQWNKLGGSLTDNLGNLTQMRVFSLGGNNFTGVIPQGLNKLTKLRAFDLGLNSLSGPIPSDLFNITTLITCQLTNNRFSGNLPRDIGIFLPSIENLILSNNDLGGILPNSISNSSQLQILDLGNSKLTGSIPSSLGDLKFLQTLNLAENMFTSEPGSSELGIITSLTRSMSLTWLRIDNNPLNGTLPLSTFGNLSSSLKEFSTAGCGIWGYIPNEIGNVSGLATLDLNTNDLIGEIPSTLNKLSNLQILDLGNNQLTGYIPNVVCELKYMGRMSLVHNQVKGSIPKCLGNISSLRYVHLRSNNLTFGMPVSIWSLQDLLELDISSNSINGSLPPQIENLKAATYINVSNNQLSGNIPITIGSLQSLSNLSLAYNRFQGPIPDSMGNMLSLSSLDLSHNMLSGTIPKSLESLKLLEHFNVSFNELYGEIPTEGPFKNFTSQSFMSNSALCGPPRFQVALCKKSQNGSKRKKLSRLVFIVLGIGAIMFLGTVMFLVIRYRKKKLQIEPRTLETIELQRMPHYALLKATNGFSDDCLLGRGSFGSVYKGTFEDGTILAIKVFTMNLEVASQTFDAECDVLRNLRHRNLIKVIGSCSNNDFKAIILEYMPNGNLEKWLYSDNYFLDIVQRLNTMIDVASALEYLHYGYPTPVVHCDLKPSNILLDENMVAHVSDFGLTKFLDEEKSITHTRTLATMGYMAPEYGLEGRVSTKSDVYSYGIMLLETFTGKRPSDQMFSGDMTLKKWVEDLLPNAPNEVIDSNLLSPEEATFKENLRCALSVLELALKCCADISRERMNMKDALAELIKIKAELMSHFEHFDLKHAMKRVVR